MYHLHREIDHNLQFVVYRLYTTEITKVQEWILVLVELHIVNQQRERICHEHLQGISYWTGMTYTSQ